VGSPTIKLPLRRIAATANFTVQNLLTVRANNKKTAVGSDRRRLEFSQRLAS